MGALAPKLMPSRWVLPTAVKLCGVVLSSRKELSYNPTGLTTFFSCQLLLHGRSTRRMKSSFVCKISSILVQLLQIKQVDNLEQEE